MRKIAIANHKGGVGKSTTTINLGAALTLLGNSVLLIDADPQGHTTLGLGISTQNRLTLAEYLTCDNVTKDDVVQKTAMNGLSLIPSDLGLAIAEMKLLQKPDKEFILAKKLSTVNHYDFMLFDCAPTFGTIPMNVFMAANEIIIPTNLGYFALEGVNTFMDTINLVNKDFGSLSNHRIDITGVLITFFENRTKLSKNIDKNLRDIFKEKVFTTTIPQSVKLNEAQSHGKSIFEYAPRCNGAKSYLAVARELLHLRPRQG